MARVFDGSNQYLRYTGVPISAPPFTAACWFYCTSVSGDSIIFSETFDAQNAHVIRLEASAGAGKGVRAVTEAGGVDANAETSTDWVINTWHHVCAVWAASDDRRIYLDGGGKDTDATDLTPTTPINTYIGGFGLVASLTADYTGSVAEFAMWNAALSDEEAAALAKGASPLTIKPGNLVVYWPLVRDNDKDVVGGYDMVAAGSPTIGTHAPGIFGRAMSVLMGKVPGGGTVYEQSVAGTLTSAGVVARRLATSLAGTLTSAGALVGKAQKALAGMLTSGGTLIGKAQKVLAGTLTTAGAIARATGKALAGTLTSAGVVVRQTAKPLAGTLTTAGTVVRRASKSLTGTLTSAGTVARGTTKSFAGALTSGGALVARAGKVLSGTLTSSGALARRTSKSLAGTLTGAGGLARRTAFSLAGTLTTSGAVTAIRIFFVSVAGTLTSIGAVSTELIRVVTSLGAVIRAVEWLRSDPRSAETLTPDIEDVETLTPNAKSVETLTPDIENAETLTPRIDDVENF